MRLASALIALVLLSLGGCSSIGFEKHTGWSDRLLGGLSLWPVRGSKVKRFEFSKNDRSVAVYTSFSEIAGPRFLRWRLEEDWLIIFDTEGRLFDELRLQHVGMVFLTASRRDGKTARFTYVEL